MCVTSPAEPPLTMEIRTDRTNLLQYEPLVVECVLSNRSDTSLQLYDSMYQSPAEFCVECGEGTNRVRMPSQWLLASGLTLDESRHPLSALARSLGPRQTMRFRFLLAMDFTYPATVLFPKEGEYHVCVVHRTVATGETRAKAVKVTYRGPATVAEETAVKLLTNTTLYACLVGAGSACYGRGGGTSGAEQTTAMKTIVGLGDATPFHKLAVASLEEFKRIDALKALGRATSRTEVVGTNLVKQDVGVERRVVKGAVAEDIADRVKQFVAAIRDGNSNACSLVLAENFMIEGGPGREEYLSQLSAKTAEMHEKKTWLDDARIHAIYTTDRSNEVAVVVDIGMVRSGEKSTRRDNLRFRNQSNQWFLSFVER